MQNLAAAAASVQHEQEHRHKSAAIHQKIIRQ